jgi:hypothetical protein
MKNKVVLKKLEKIKEKGIWDVIYITQNVIYHKINIGAVVMFSLVSAKDEVRVPPPTLKFFRLFCRYSPDQVW